MDIEKINWISLTLDNLVVDREELDELVFTVSAIKALSQNFKECYTEVHKLREYSRQLEQDIRAIRG